ncbi:uncharacterized protein J8A68_002682 [[Candida] subhashii]|uniref:Pre-mRNA processing factor 4 (PRP4)-like domain-containing protein n=1 Tax=[Candida] subhashii TaxID=561895 RepID=A0A8J5QIU3_9ASCO|nr:uncharacterized protein J8A68_002682 [[Candida] subhashii]KAG7663822.1 hypothetical protein J8A68_002682 [[Candida] subhashii]
MDISEIPIINDTDKAIDFPLADEGVEQELRKHGAPIRIEGEDADARRERLRNILEPSNHTFDDINEEQSGEDEDKDLEDDEIFYTPGDAKLYDARVEILHDSMKRSSQRIHKLKERAKEQDFTRVLKNRRHINSKLASYSLYGSQFIPGITRAISSIRFSKRSDLIACGSWDGSINILDSSSLNDKYKSGPGFHTEKVSALDWNFATEENSLVSGGNEGTINFWRLNQEEDKKLSPTESIKDAHNMRITKTLFHPRGNYIISTSFDQTWKLWDTNTSTCLLQQEGHSKEVFSGSIHPDGSLFASGGLDGMCYIWDLRSGRFIADLRKHVKGIYSVDWSPNGYHLATASGDCSVKIWDLRRIDRTNEELFSIPAHSKLVSEVRFFHRRESNDALTKDVALDSNGSFLVTSSYDGLINVWSADNWIKVNTLRGHNDKVMACDISGDGTWIASSGWDRSVKLWGI